MWHHAPRVTAEFGYLRLFGHAVKATLARVIYAWNRLARHRNHVFVCEPLTSGPPVPENLTIMRCGANEDIPEVLRLQLTSVHDDLWITDVVWEQRHGAVLWLALVDAKYAASSMSRRGKHFARCFVPLDDDDVVIFRNWVAPAFRGRGLCPALMSRILCDEVLPGQRAFADCRVYNRSSIRSIEKAGFRRIATAKPLLREEVVK